MANEINIAVTSIVSIPSVGSSTAAKSLNLNCTTGVFYEAAVSLATSATAIAIGGVTASTQQALFILNQDATNYVEISMVSDGTVPFARIKPGEFLTIPMVPSATYYSKAHTGACLCLVQVLDS